MQVREAAYGAEVGQGGDEEEGRYGRGEEVGEGGGDEDYVGGGEGVLGYYDAKGGGERGGVSRASPT